MQTILITGGGRGIGAALAKYYAARSIRLILIGRTAETLAATAEICRLRGAEVHEIIADVGVSENICPILQEWDARYPVDLVIANAGVSAGRTESGTLEAWQNAAAVARTNLEGVVNTVAPLAEAMRKRGKGQIALVSSLAGLLPLPDSPSYCGSKAGVIAYGRALDTMLRRQGVPVTVFCPGFIESDMSARFSGEKPFQLSAEKAAQKMALWIRKKRRLVAFPWQMAIPALLAQRLPLPFQAWILARVSRFTVQPEPILDGRVSEQSGHQDPL